MTSALLFDRYRPVRPIGVGRVGSVYLVEDITRNHEQLALKVLMDDQALDQFTELRFDREASVTQKLDHPHIVKVYDTFFIQEAEICGEVYKNRSAYIMEYIEGSDLAGLATQGNLSDRKVDRIFLQLLSALEALHQRGIYHRDIKLENVLVRTNGDIVLTDLGIMKWDSEIIKTKPGTFMGTVQYFPPEYLLQSIYDAQGDIYATGILLLEVLIGHARPTKFAGEKLAQHLINTNFKIEDELFAQLDPKYEYIARKATNVARENRYQSAREMREDLEKNAGALLSSTRTPTHFSTIKKISLILTGAVLITILVMIALRP